MVAGGLCRKTHRPSSAAPPVTEPEPAPGQRDTKVQQPLQTPKTPGFKADQHPAPPSFPLRAASLSSRANQRNDAPQRLIVRPRSAPQPVVNRPVVLLEQAQIGFPVRCRQFVKTLPDKRHQHGLHLQHAPPAPPMDLAVTRLRTPIAHRSTLATKKATIIRVYRRMATAMHPEEQPRSRHTGHRDRQRPGPARRPRHPALRRPRRRRPFSRAI